MKAKDKFKVGMVVVPSASQRRDFPKKEYKQAKVVGFGRESTTVAVVRDGAKTRVAWHQDFWEPT